MVRGDGAGGERERAGGGGVRWRVVLLDSVLSEGGRRLAGWW